MTRHEFHSDERSGGCERCAGRHQCFIGRLVDSRKGAGWSPLVKERSVRKDGLLLTQGQTGRSFLIVKAGTVMLLRGGADNVERPIGIFGTNQPIGTTALLHEPASTSCRALTHGRVCEISIGDAAERGLLDADFFRALALSHAHTNARLVQWAHIARIRGALGQLCATLLELSHIQRSTLVHLPSHKMLAELLSTTRETVARTLSLLASQQAVTRRDRRHCEIQRPLLMAILRGDPLTPSAASVRAASKALRLTD